MNVHDLLYIKEGEWNIAQDGINYFLTSGDVLLLQGGRHHYGTAPCEGMVKTRFIHFEPHPNDSVSDKDENSEAFYCFPMVVHAADHPLVEKYFNRVISAFWSDGVYEKAKAAAYLDLLLCEISSIGTKKNSLVDDIKAQINKNPHRFISNEEFAKKYGWSVRTITSKFKESTGTSIHAWQMEQKCRIADELLLNEPTLTLKEVAATYGFYDEYHFGKCFKRVMGRSPKGKR
jgi:AraC-like DNA-binding protein